MTGATEVCRRAGDVSPPTSNDSGSGAMSVVVAVEKSLLRTLAFVLYQLDRNCAKYCASSILQWYMQLQTQLPLAAVDSLDRVADSVISLSDAQFTEFWRSLVAKELDEVSCRRQQTLRHRHRHHHDASSTSEVDGTDVHEQEQHVVKRFYQQLFLGVQRFFAAEPSDKGRTQTPCTSPVDLMDASHRQPHSTRHQYHDTNHESDCSMSDVARIEDEFEPGWAVEYMEQDSNIPSEMFRRMTEMMHSNVPANLFRATVTLSGCDDDDRDMNDYMGAVTPGSFPPTPITRDLQTRRMNHYTITVLDHATLTLRLLTEETYSS
ncbi:hypothetical protein F442_18892 [Phytophthora nicotianae P10297]|uniref:Uncharacterized protein n=3 Tax=Phytophthora nicotianae TaxID=4792 RepID=W2QWX4_PHYN3|nr:hypothetical protein PPTG_05230 [Phytophthora nicotianae INRA-310]ETL81381.1 hypothetical protein L917_18267 [Phytophthora nicotianae]ETN17426.1 hypothetical protein PPTG_05230 [Phytophthora nicotianae INRA-310]ETP32381.1 hypothetical protein F442_18892 [Phytophthora nicotianae P10297]KUF95693.1 hypothetical protein AM588_10009358 [Phytophthora nicotianae]